MDPDFTSQVEQLVEQFEVQWQSGGNPEIGFILSQLQRPDLRRTVLLELIAIDLEYRWRHLASLQAEEDGGQETRGPILEDYAAKWPEIGTLDRLPEMLIREEFRIRHRWGDSPSITSYMARFSNPGLQPSLERTLEEIQHEGGAFEGETTQHLFLTPRQGEQEENIGETLLDPNPPAQRYDFALRSTANTPREPPIPAVLGDYRLISILGQGGMGTVYHAHHCTTARDVALKIIRPELLSSIHGGQKSEIAERFSQEIKAAARLEHDHIVRVYEAGHWERTPYFSMQYIPGTDLDTRLRDGPMSSREAATVLLPICHAIQAAHDQGVLHRDIKPKNILLDRSGRPYIGDFGLAKLIEGEVLDTHTGSIQGTPPYMSPEQAQAEVTDGRTDVYSLGATLYQTTTGRPPFKAATPIDTLRQVVHDEPVSPRQLNSAIPRDLETICLKCLEKQPSQRYSSAGDLASDLACFLKGLPIRARPVSTLERGFRWCRRNPLLATSAGTIALLLIMLALGGTIYAAKMSEFARSLQVALNDAEEQQRIARREEAHAQQMGNEARASERKARIAEQEALAAQETAEHERQVAEARLLASQVAAAQRAWEVADMPQFFRLLETMAPSWERNYLAQMPTWGHQQFSASEEVLTVGFSPDGHQFAASMAPGQLTFFNSQSGKSEETIAVHEIQGLEPTSIQSLRYSRDGRYLAVGGESGLILWELAARAVALHLPGRGNRTVAISADGQWIARNGPNHRGRITVCDTDAGEEQFTHDDTMLTEIIGLSFDPSGSKLIAIYKSLTFGATVYQFDLRKGSIDWKFRTHLHGIALSATVNPEGTRLAIGMSDGSLGLWDLEKQEFVRRLSGHAVRVPLFMGQFGITDIQFSADGRYLVSGSHDHTVRVWNLESFEERQIFKGHRSRVNAIALSPHGQQVLSGGADARLRLWNGNKQLPHTVDTGPGTVGGLDLHPATGKLLLARDHSAEIWDVTALKPEREIKRDAIPFPVSVARFLPEGELVVTGERSGTVALWEITSARKVDRSAGGKIASLIRTLSGRTKRDGELRSFQPEMEWILDLAVSPDGQWVAVPGKEVVRLWNTRTGAEGDSFTLPLPQITPEMYHAIQEELDQPVGAEKFKFADPTAKGIESVAFSRDGHRLAAGGSNGSVTLWDISSRKVLHRLVGHTGPVKQIVFHPDGRTLITAGQDASIVIWDLDTGLRRALLSEHTEAVFDLALSPDSKYLASCSRDGTVRLWHLEIAQSTMVLRTPPLEDQLLNRGVVAVTFDQDGSCLLAGTTDGFLVIFETNPATADNDRSSHK